MPATSTRRWPMMFLPRLKVDDVARADRPAPAPVGARRALKAPPKARRRIERDIRKRCIDLGDRHQVRPRQAQRRSGRGVVGHLTGRLRSSVHHRGACRARRMAAAPSQGPVRSASGRASLGGAHDSARGRRRDGGGRGGLSRSYSTGLSCLSPMAAAEREGAQRRSSHPEPGK